MLSKFSHLVAIASFTTLTCVISHPSLANPMDTSSKSSITPEVVDPIPYIPVNRLINQALFSHSGTFFDNTTMAGQLNNMFGWRSFPQGSYPENTIISDALLVNVIVVDYFRQLQSRDPDVRTSDLPSPFNTSLREISDYREQ